MTQRTRRRLFILLVFAFFIIGGSAAFYAQGYRINLADFSVQKVGGIYVRSFPRAAVYMDDELIKENFWFFQNGFLINDLFPQEYEIRLVNENYEEWEQTVEVKPALVSEVKFAVLIPKVRNTIPNATSVQEFWINERGLILNSSGTLSLTENAIPGTIVLEEERDSNRILTIDKFKNIFIYNYETNSSTSISQIVKNAGFPVFSKARLGTNPSEVILYGLSKIFILDLPSKRFTNITNQATSTLEISPLTFSREYIAWTEFEKSKNISTLVVYNKNRKTKTIHPVQIEGKTIQLDWRGNRIAILQDNGEIFMGDPLGTTMERLASNALEFAFTDSLSRIAVREKDSLELFPLRNLDSEKYIKFDLPSPDKIKKMEWYKDERHIFLVYEDKTMFLDIDDKFLEHFVEVGTNNSKYDSRNNQLYYLKDQSMFRVDFAE